MTPVWVQTCETMLILALRRSFHQSFCQSATDTGNHDTRNACSTRLRPVAFPTAFIHLEVEMAVSIKPLQ